MKSGNLLTGDLIKAILRHLIRRINIKEKKIIKKYKIYESKT